MDLQTLGALAEIFGFMAVIAAIIFGFIQVRQFKRSRQDLAAIELARSFQNREFTQAFRLIHSLPEDISAEEFAQKDKEYIDAAFSLSMKYETMGVLVYRDVVPISAVQELVGGVAITLWQRLCPWIYSLRKDQNNVHILEWFEWLVNKLEENDRGDQEPAQIRLKDWVPPVER